MCGLGTVTITEDNNRLDIAITTIDSLFLCKVTQALKCFVTLVYGYFKSDYDGFITLVVTDCINSIYSVEWFVSSIPQSCIKVLWNRKSRISQDNRLGLYTTTPYAKKMPHKDACHRLFLIERSRKNWHLTGESLSSSGKRRIGLIEFNSSRIVDNTNKTWYYKDCLGVEMDYDLFLVAASTWGWLSGTFWCAEIQQRGRLLSPKVSYQQVDPWLLDIGFSLQGADWSYDTFF